VIKITNDITKSFDKDSASDIVRLATKKKKAGNFPAFFGLRFED